VSGIGEKTAQELIGAYGELENIVAHASEITKKRPREALTSQVEKARLSKQLVTIRDDVPILLDLDQYRPRDFDIPRLRQLYLELEFTSLLKALEAPGTATIEVRRRTAYQVVDNLSLLDALVQKIRAAGRFSFDTETVVDADSPAKVDPLRSKLVGMSIAVTPNEAYYLPFAHRTFEATQGELLAVGKGAEAEGRVRPAKVGTSIAARVLADGAPAPVNLPSILSESLASFRSVLENPDIRKVAQNAKYDLLVLRGCGIDV